MQIKGQAQKQADTSDQRDGCHDVIIIGAGLSGIGQAAHLQDACPGKSFILLEARQAIGGTWDLFRYPGVRSDSDMYTLGYDFKPWREPKAIADGPSILRYIRDTATERGIDKRIRFGHRVLRADWSTAQACWTLGVAHAQSSAVLRMRCRFLIFCGGYYSYSQPHRPKFAGEDEFRGQLVHPQFWPEHLDYSGKRVIVIGSGATAVTLVPAMAAEATHVTMLQRSPTYMVALPARDAIAEWLRRHLPARLAYALVRMKNVTLGMLFFKLARTRPERIKNRLIKDAARLMGPGQDIARDFTPRYKPWDQRLCVVPDADLFRAIRKGRASVLTDTIEAFTAHGIRLTSGRQLDADIIVTATGLTLNVLGDIALAIDERECDLAQVMAYKGMMYSDVPNLITTFGYTNASWTLKADLTARYACRLLQHMDRHHQDIVFPRRDPTVAVEPFLDFSSGYIQRALSKLPKQGASRPWRLYQNYLLDLLALRFGRIDDGVLSFASARAPAGSGISP